MPSEKDVILSDLLALNMAVAKDTDTQVLVEKIIRVAAKAASADGCFFFEVGPDKFMSLIYSNIKSLSERQVGLDNLDFFEPIAISDIKNKAAKRPAEICALNREIINTDNIYHDDDMDTSFISGFDYKND